jgi:hypothetical protein
MLFIQFLAGLGVKMISKGMARILVPVFFAMSINRNRWTAWV